jgi:hypothetical protein
MGTFNPTPGAETCLPCPADVYCPTGSHSVDLNASTIPDRVAGVDKSTTIDNVEQARLQMKTAISNDLEAIAAR